MNSLQQTICALVVPLLWSSAIAQEDSAENPQKTEAEMIDEVTVMGPRSLALMRKEIIAAEDNVFAIFNELNSDDGYDIICEKETRIGSQIPHRVCKARLFRDRKSEAAEDFYEDSAAAPVRLNAKKHNEILREKMRALAMENPQLVDALRKRQALLEEFAAQRNQTFE